MADKKKLAIVHLSGEGSVTYKKVMGLKDGLPKAF